MPNKPKRKKKNGMIVLYTIPSRQFNNTTIDTGSILISDYIDVSLCKSILIRFEIESMNAGSQIITTYSMINSGEYMGGASNVYNTVGKHQLGFGRGDFDISTIVNATIQFIGRLRVNAVVYCVQKGEDVLEWL